MYKGGTFRFSFSISDNYPHEAPKIRCLNKIYHPNIDTAGAVCLNILREEWKPVLTIQAVIYGLQYLFLVIFFTLLSLFFLKIFKVPISSFFILNLEFF